MGWFSKDKKPAQPALPAPAVRPVEDKTFPPPVNAVHGTYFATRTFVDTGALEYSASKMEAICHSGGWRLIRTDITPNFINPQESPEELLYNRTVEKSDDCLTFWDAIRRMSEFNAEISKIRTPVGPRRDEMGNDHFQNFGLREGTVGFDAHGLAFVARDGMIPSGGYFFEKDLVDVLRSYESRRDNSEAGRRNMFADIFNVQAGPATDYKKLTADLQMKGYIEEVIAATADARKILKRFDVYFEGEQRQQTVDQWLKQARTDLRSSLLPEKFRAYTLTIKDILESDALKQKVGAEDNVEFAIFADSLKRLAATHVNTIGDDFRSTLSRFGKYADKIAELNRARGVDPGFGQQDIFSPVYLALFQRKLELTYHAFRAKAQYEFLTHVKGDKTEHIASLDETVKKMSNLLKSIDSSGRTADFTADEIISMPRPSLAFIDRLIEEFSAGAGEQAAKFDNEKISTAAAGADWTWNQLALPFEDGENGLTKHRLELDLDAFLTKVKAEKGEKFAEQMMEQIGSLALLNSSLVDSKKNARSLTAAALAAPSKLAP